MRFPPWAAQGPVQPDAVKSSFGPHAKLLGRVTKHTLTSTCTCSIHGKKQPRINHGPADNRRRTLLRQKDGATSESGDRAAAVVCQVLLMSEPANTCALVSLRAL